MSGECNSSSVDGNTIGPLFQGKGPLGGVTADAALIEVDNAVIDRLSLRSHRAVRYATEDEFEGHARPLLPSAHPSTSDG